MFLYIYPPTAVSVTFPPGAATSANQLLILAELEDINQNQHLPVINKAILDFSADNVDNSAWVEVIADVGATEIKKAQIFMSSGEPLELGFGAAASEVSHAYIIPGGNGYLDLEIPANTRVSVRAVNAVTVSSGVLLINFMG
jgi:hypothetical protein